MATRLQGCIRALGYCWPKLIRVIFSECCQKELGWTNLSNTRRADRTREVAFTNDHVQDTDLQALRANWYVFERSVMPLRSRTWRIAEERWSKFLLLLIRFIEPNNRTKMQDDAHPVQQLQDPKMQVLRAEPVLQIRQELHLCARSWRAPVALRGDRHWWCSKPKHA